MADSPDAIAKKEPLAKEPEAPVRDPIVSRSTSGILLICALLMIGVLAWALYDEAYGQRPWKQMQQEFVSRENRLLRRLKRTNKSEQEVRESEEYKSLAQEAEAARQEIEPQRKEIDKKVKIVQDQLDAVTDGYQNARGQITVINYRVETAEESKKERLRKEVEEKKAEAIKIKMPADDGSGKVKEEKLNYQQIEAKYNELKDAKTRLLTEKAELLKSPTEFAKKRDDYLKENVSGLTNQAIDSLIRRNESFDFSMRQVNVTDANIVDRCETCHLGVREPAGLELTPANMKAPRKKPDALARAFVSHPSKELLAIHNPDRFGCSSCHGGNGRATTSMVKGHGRHKFWLHPLHERENMEAGCQQCHSNDRVLQGANTLNLGKDLFQNRGCVGCHRSEGFDRESDALTNARQMISQLEEEIDANERESKQASASIGNVSDEDAQKLLARAEYLRVTNSQIAARLDQLNTQSKYLMQDQKKVGPNLKDVRLKLRKEWIPEWLRDPQNFRPGTKMPTFWRIDGKEDQGQQKDDPREVDERKAIAAYLWQESFDGKTPEQQQGNGANGKELFETKGCMACHSIGAEGQHVGGDFAANLQRIGEKASYDYVVRWIHNPRERWAPYCPKEKRDLTREDYEKKGLPFVFDTELHSKCPNDGAELQVQNMTVMPNFRLTEQESRDIATYLFSLGGQASYADASYMDDPNLKAQGQTLIKQYGCAGCHEIKGFEDEQRIGKELTTEGSTPIERLDFALLTHDAEKGKDPLNLYPDKKEKEWYNHKGFFERKITEPGIYDHGKEKEAKDRLRMPRPYMPPEWRNALTTFLLGSVGLEGANVPQTLFYKPDDRRKAIQDGWWIVKKYNCMGCHNVQVGQKSVLSGLPLYQSAEWKDQLPPQLTSEGARVDPNWLLRFLRDPSLSDEEGAPAAGRSDKTVGDAAAGKPNTSPYAEGQQQPQAGANGKQNATPTNNQSAAQKSSEQGKLKPQPGLDRNGVRPYLKARMPTFSFSPNELRTLVRFFMAVSSQQEPYIKEELPPLSEQERTLARQLFTSQGAPCLKCHITGDAEHDKTALAPNFLLAGERLKPSWTFRWLLDPQQISPGTAMPSGLFKKESDRWVFSGPTPESFNEYHRDHADLLVRYMFLMTPDEQRRLASTAPVPTSGQSPAPKEETPATNGSSQKVSRNAPRKTGRRGSGRALALKKPERAPQPVSMRDRRDRLAVTHWLEGS
ncbi:MAG: c-type cytochrome [Pyrinomonadaceae bacterium]